MYLVLFIILAVVAVGAGVAVVLNRNPVHSALFLVVNFFALAVLFLMLNAEFLAAVQVIVYAGAIMVLFLFVIMLLSVRGEEDLPDRLKRMRPAALAFSLALLAEVVAVTRTDFITGSREGITSEVIARIGSVRIIGESLYTNYLFPFEVTSVLLLIAIVGAIYLGKRKI